MRSRVSDCLILGAILTIPFCLVGGVIGFVVCWVIFGLMALVEWSNWQSSGSHAGSGLANGTYSGSPFANNTVELPSDPIERDCAMVDMAIRNQIANYRRRGLTVDCSRMDMICSELGLVNKKYIKECDHKNKVFYVRKVKYEHGKTIVLKEMKYYFD